MGDVSTAENLGIENSQDVREPIEAPKPDASPVGPRRKLGFLATIMAGLSTLRGELNPTKIPEDKPGTQVQPQQEKPMSQPKPQEQPFQPQSQPQTGSSTA